MKDLLNIENLSQFEFGAIIITTLIAGLVFGCLIAYSMLKKSNAPTAAAAVKAKEEFEEYKDKVDDHFNKTSEMFKDVTTQYKKLYDHMAVGAIELAKADTIAMPRLEVQDKDTQGEIVETALDPDSADVETIDIESTDTDQQNELSEASGDVEETLTDDDQSTSEASPTNVPEAQPSSDDAQQNDSSETAAESDEVTESESIEETQENDSKK